GQPSVPGGGMSLRPRPRRSSATACSRSPAIRSPRKSKDFRLALSPGTQRTIGACGEPKRCACSRPLGSCRSSSDVIIATWPVSHSQPREASPSARTSGRRSATLSTVPLGDGGTTRLPRLIGQGRALDMILTGRPVTAEEAVAIGLANRVVPRGEARTAAVELAQELVRLPQVCLRSDRLSAYEQWDLD